MKRMKMIGLVAVLSCVTGVLQGCAIGAPRGDGYIAITADARGMDAFGRTTNGWITNGKASPDVDTPAWQTQRLVERERTRRELRPSIFSGLFSSNTPQRVEVK